MNPIVDIVFTLTWVLLLVWAIRSMAQGWSKPVRDYNGATWTTQVKKPVHPEMKDVEAGTELMGVNFTEPKTECSLEEYRDLQARIEELRQELEDDDDDDDDGGDVVALKR
jgi:hypothetical protein